MKIAVIGLYYATNLGDAVICDCVAHMLREAFPSSEIDVVDIEGKTEFPKERPTSIRVLRKVKRRLDREYWMTKHNIKDYVYRCNEIDVATRQDFYDSLGERNYDAVVFAGGQLFMDWLSVDICEIVKRFEEKGVPVFYNACGVGLGVSEAIKHLLSKHLQADNVKLISSRDDVELINQRYLNGKESAKVTYDPALWTQNVYQIKKMPDGMLGLGIMYSTHANLNKITNFWIRLIRELDSRNIKWKMFCNGAREDYDYGCYVLKKLNKDPKACILDCAKTPDELVSQISRFDSLISFRLHSHIIATSLDIPAVAVVWDNKLRFFYRHLGCEERCKTIDDSAESILEAWKRARAEGYQREVIEEQKQFARNLLIEAVTREVCNE